jgi:copper transport protein
VRRLLATGALVVAIVALLASPAYAHAELSGSDPESGATLPAGQSPASITLQFTERVELPQDAIRVLASSGNAVQGVGRAGHGDDDSVVTASLPKLADGTYVVDWRVVSADSHPINGAYTFAVGRASADADQVAGLLEGDEHRGVGIAFGLTRALAFASVLGLLGAIAFIRMCSPRSGDDATVRGLLWVTWVVALVTALLGIGMQAAYSTGQDISGLWDTTAISDVMDTRFGQSWLIRAGLLLLVLPALRAPGRKRPVFVNVVDALLGIAVLATFTFAEHARTGRWVLLGTVTDLVHLVSASLWLGGVAVLATLLVRRSVPHDTPEVTGRFSRVAAPAITVVAVSGAVQAWRQTEGLDSVFDTTYGRLLLTKIGLVVMIVAAASVSRHIVRLWGERQLAPTGPGARRADADPDDIRELRNAVVVEVALAAVVLVVTAILVNTVPARVATGAEPPSAAAPAAPAGYSASLQDNGLALDVTLSPGLTGTNEMRVATTRDGAPFDPIEIAATLTNRERDISLDVPLASDAPGSGTASGRVDVPFAGTWELEIRALRTDVDEAVLTDTVEVQ